MLLFFFAGAVHAQMGGIFPDSSIRGYQILYSGEKGKSLAEAGSGYGVEFENLSDSSILSFYLKARLAQSAGSQNFLDGTTQTKSSFTFYQAGGELGFYLFPLRRSKNGLNVFIGAGGIADYNYIYLDKNISFTTISNSDQATSFGYSLSVGAEFIFKSTMSHPWSFNTQVNYRQEKSNLLQQSNFNLSGLQLSVGLGF